MTRIENPLETPPEPDAVLSARDFVTVAEGADPKGRPSLRLRAPNGDVFDAFFGTLIELVLWQSQFSAWPGIGRGPTLRSEPQSLGKIPYVGMRPAQTDARTLRAAFDAAFESAFGPSARRRMALVKDAITILAAARGLGRVVYSRTDDALLDVRGAKILTPVSTETVDLGRFLEPVRRAGAGRTSRVASIVADPDGLTAHERLQLLGTTREGFAAFGIDLTPWLHRHSLI